MNQWSITAIIKRNFNRRYWILIHMYTLPQFDWRLNQYHSTMALLLSPIPYILEDDDYQKLRCLVLIDTLGIQAILSDHRVVTDHHYLLQIKETIKRRFAWISVSVLHRRCIRSIWFSKAHLHGTIDNNANRNYVSRLWIMLPLPYQVLKRSN